jgi:hypothetical protein
MYEDQDECLCEDGQEIPTNLGEAISEMLEDELAIEERCGLMVSFLMHTDADAEPRFFWNEESSRRQQIKRIRFEFYSSTFSLNEFDWSSPLAKSVKCFDFQVKERARE